MGAPDSFAPDEPDRVSHDSKSPGDDLASLRSEVDTLRARLERRWYKSASGITSVLAVLVSVIALVLTAIRSDQQAERAARAELMALIGQINRTEAEISRLMTEAGKNPGLANMAVGPLRNQQATAARRAFELTRELEDSVSSTELNSVSTGLLNARFSEEGRLVAEISTSRAVNQQDRFIAHRLFASANFHLKRFDAGRAAAEEAKSIAQEATGDPRLRLQLQLDAVLFWAFDEAASGHKSEALRLIDEEAQTLLQDVPDGMLREQLLRQTHDLRQRIAPEPPQFGPLEMVPPPEALGRFGLKNRP